MDSDFSHGTKRANGSPFASDGVVAVADSKIDAKGRRLAKGKVVFNQKSFFFTGKYKAKDFADFLTKRTRKALGVGSLNVEHIMELIVLHELKHIDDKKGEYDDFGKINKRLNNEIRRNCFSKKER